LRLVITSADVLRVMAITELDTVLRIYSSLDAAQERPPGQGRRIILGQRGSPVPPPEGGGPWPGFPPLGTAPMADRGPLDRG
jgi:hypothetical protein